MKRTSVRYNVTPSYSNNPISASESRKIRRNATLVLIVGILLIGLVFSFILKNTDIGLLFAAGLVKSGFVPSDTPKNDNPALVGFAVLLVLGLAASIFLF
jgi:hypothetical protein